MMLTKSRLFGALIAIAICALFIIFPAVVPRSNVERFETSTGSNATREVPAGYLDVLPNEKVENLVNASMPIYLTSFDRQSMQQLMTSNVWPNLGHKKNTISFTTERPLTVDPLIGVRITETIVGPDSDKLLTSNMDRKLTTCTFAWVLRSDLAFGTDRNAGSEYADGVERISLFQCGANVSGNIGVRVAIISSEQTEDTVVLEVRWGNTASKFRLPRLPLIFGDNLLVLVNDNSRLRVYMHSLGLDAAMKVEVVSLRNTAGVALPLSNTPCTLFQGAERSTVDNKLRMFMMSYQAFTETDIKLLAARYVDDLNVRMLQERAKLAKQEKEYSNEKKVLEEKITEQEKKLAKWTEFTALPADLSPTRYQIGSKPEATPKVNGTESGGNRVSNPEQSGAAAVPKN